MTQRTKTLHGASIGILMLDSSFNRFVGDIGNATTWPFPVHYRIVRGASPRDILKLETESLLEPMKAAADDLIRDGVDGITTTCGLLGLYQQELAESLPVPVATSALLQVPVVERLIPAGRRAGILTYSATALSPALLTSVGVALDTPVVGIPADSAFFQWILKGQNDVPFSTLKSDVLDAAEELVTRHPEVGAIVSECTNLTPFARDIRDRFNLPVYDMVTLMHWFHLSLNPIRYSQS